MLHENFCLYDFITCIVLFVESLHCQKGNSATEITTLHKIKHSLIIIAVSQITLSNSSVIQSLNLIDYLLIQSQMNQWKAGGQVTLPVQEPESKYTFSFIFVAVGITLSLSARQSTFRERNSCWMEFPSYHTFGFGLRQKINIVKTNRHVDTKAKLSSQPSFLYICK